MRCLLYSFFRCYLCGEKFTFSQELSRHIRDKVCKYEELNTSVDDLEQEHSSISLLKLPIITDMAHDVAVPELIVSSQPHTENMHSESVDNDNTENDSKTQENSGLNNESTGMPVQWACRQCDFR